MKTINSLLWTLPILLCSTRLFAFDYSNPQLGFTARLPDGLDDVSTIMRVKTLISRGKLDETGNGLIRLVSIQDLGGTIGREDLSKSTSKPPNVRLEKAVWKNFEIDVFWLLEDIGSIPLVTFNAQVPLKPHAIQLTVSGPRSDEIVLRKEMQTIVASIEGPTNWLTPEEVRRRQRPNLITFFVGLFALIVGKLRITRHYGLSGTGARVAGFAIIIAGVGLPILLQPVLRFTHSLITDPVWFLLAWLVIWCAAMFGIMALLVSHYGNAYAKDTDEAAPLPATTVPPKERVVVLPTSCGMCQALIPPELQATAKVCPSCGADLSRWKR